jgi:glycosyltransferase A (GT-A) superfamily protein (DUF2064 family)
VPGFAKTRLCPPASPGQAAEIAAAALLDTLDAVLGTPYVLPVVALTGELALARRAAELRRLLRHTEVIDQRGNGLAARLAAAHADTATRHPGLPVLQIGMDTPQLTPDLLGAAADQLANGADAVLGPAADGGWWGLGLREPRHAAVLREVPMSRPDTEAHTRDALRRRGLRVEALPALSDVDTMSDAEVVARFAQGGRFALAVADVVRARSVGGGVR